jgi:3-isopropylmalate/(R)-2-methylmalate dehydratase small subunit
MQRRHEPITGVVVAIDRRDIDTDQILPKQFLRRLESTGFGPALFHTWRSDPNDAISAKFPLNDPRYSEASILITGRNLGCGSAREQAVWALRDYGFRVLIAPSFAHLFAVNCAKNLIVCVTVSENTCRTLISRASNQAPHELTIDVERSRLLSDGDQFEVGVDSYARRAYMSGVDDFARTQRLLSEIEAFEHRVTRMRQLTAAAVALTVHESRPR